jgi:hypothetical protein
MPTRMTFSESSTRPFPRPPASALLLNLTIAILGLAFLCCLLFGFVAFINAYVAVKRVQGQPYHATTFQVTRSYYQKSAGMHGPDISVYARGTVEGQEEWMDLFAYLKRAEVNKRSLSDQAELNALVPPGTVIPVYLFPNLKGRSRIQLIDVLPPGEASRRTETWVLRRAPVALAVLGGLIFVLVRIRQSPSRQSSTEI